ncbi:MULTISPECIES: sensor histidine kinase [Aequorivita]|uniref:Histidine kinase/HSP90-like ATPase domain-containing protein n=1 Tax=Aequorivita iocasae TaxID=2803865 RepID=A0ABX7DQ94_9FLAO|nr:MULTISPECIES: tetratricopeptide repeat-containing sensor histidine kinase [Aequorivita]QQX75987.1 hypothetical protein JK629_11665 [Aequorivita iocasae]UCA55448.1 hypothetical protein LDL78_11720 [Aequorivita sp. F7]
MKYTNPDLANSISDSLLKIETKPFGSDAYAAKAYVKLIRFQYDSVYSFLKKSITLDRQNQDSIRLARDYNLMGIYYKDVALKDSAVFYYTKAVQIIDKKDAKLAGVYNFELSRYYSLIGDKNRQIRFLKKSKEFSNKARDTLTLYNIEEYENNLFKKAGGDYISGKKQYLFSKSSKNSYLLAWSQQKYADGIISVDSLDRAKVLIDSSINYFKSINNLYLLYVAYSSSANIAYISKDDEERLKIYNAQYNIVKNTEHIFKAANTYNLGDFYLHQKKYDKAKKFLLEVLETNKHQEIQPVLILLTYESLSEIYENRGNFEVALEYHKKFKEIEDMLYNTQVTAQVTDYKIKYETQEKEKENLQLKQDNAEKELKVQQATNLNQRYGFIALTAFLGIFGIFYYSKNRRRKLRDEHIINIAQTKQKEHEKIGADLHSTKAKDLEKIASNLEQKGEVEIAKKVREVKDSIRLLSHELFQIPFSQLEFDDQIINLLFDYNSDSLKITHAGIHTIPWAEVDDTIKRNLYLIISEAISNIKNHSQATTANVKFQKTNKNIDVTITDNGIGFTDEDLKKGHGIGNMRMRVNEIKGSIRFDAVKNKGSEIGIFITAF